VLDYPDYFQPSVYRIDIGIQRERYMIEKQLTFNFS